MDIRTLIAGAGAATVGALGAVSVITDDPKAPPSEMMAPLEVSMMAKESTTAASDDELMFCAPELDRAGKSCMTRSALLALGEKPTDFVTADGKPRSRCRRMSETRV